MTRITRLSLLSFTAYIGVCEVPTAYAQDENAFFGDEVADEEWAEDEEQFSEEKLSEEEVRSVLNAYGEWVWTGRYGEVWRPWGMEATWRPYSHGQWVSINDGWRWRSSFSWGHVPFHYGRWAQLSSFGWVWVPGYEYSPAWVVWVEDSSQVGWAPLPPRATWQGSFFVGSIPTYSWVFCNRSLFNQPLVRFTPRWRGYRGATSRYQRRYYRGRHHPRPRFRARTRPRRGFIGARPRRNRVTNRVFRARPPIRRRPPSARVRSQTRFRPSRVNRVRTNRIAPPRTRPPPRSSFNSRSRISPRVKSKSSSPPTRVRSKPRSRTTPVPRARPSQPRTRTRVRPSRNRVRPSRNLGRSRTRSRSRGGRSRGGRVRRF